MTPKVRALNGAWLSIICIYCLGEFLYEAETSEPTDLSYIPKVVTEKKKYQERKKSEMKKAKSENVKKPKLVAPDRNKISKTRLIAYFHF